MGSRQPMLLIAIALALACPPALASAAPANREPEAKRLEQQLVAPCCWRQNVAVHDSRVAQEIRADVRVRLARGETPTQVLDAYVQRYGTAILIEPPATGTGLPLHVLPPVALLLSGALLVLVIRRFTQRPIVPAEPAAPAPASAPASRYARQLDDDLDAMD